MARPDPSSVASPAGLARAFRLLGAKTSVGKRWRAAMVVALISDAASVWWHWAPPVQIPIDVGTAVLLMICLRWRWAYLPVLALEAFPVSALFPWWALVILGMAAFSDDGKENDKKQKADDPSIIDVEAE